VQEWKENTKLIHNKIHNTIQHKIKVYGSKKKVIFVQMLMLRHIYYSDSKINKKKKLVNHSEQKEKSSGCKNEHDYKNWSKHHGSRNPRARAMRRWQWWESLWWNCARWHDFHHQFLPFLTLIFSSTDEVEHPRAFKNHCAVSIIKHVDGAVWVTVKVFPSLHIHNWVILVLKNCTTQQQLM